MNGIIDIKFRIAVKAFLVCNNKLLVIKRGEEDVQSPGIWEIPGGRLELGEDPILGLIRELREETGLYIRPILPLSVRHFIRDDEQIITMLIFFCKLSGGDLRLSDEHSTFDWVDIENCKEKLSSFFHKEADIYKKLNLHNLVDF
jgi:8-oxo-dGTP diphosphatase